MDKLGCLTLVTMLVACGGASPLSVCKKSCDKTIACTGGTTTEIAQCKAACDSNDTLASSTAGCTNASDILSCTSKCLDLNNCNDEASCVSGCPKCIATGGDPGKDGGTMGDASDTTDGTAACTAFCQKLQACAPMATTADCPTACQHAATADMACVNSAISFSCATACDTNATCSTWQACLETCTQTC